MSDAPTFPLSEFPVHLGLGATVVREPRFTGGMEWYMAYGDRHAADHIGPDGRQVGPAVPHVLRREERPAGEEGESRQPQEAQEQNDGVPAHEGQTAARGRLFLFTFGAHGLALHSDAGGSGLYYSAATLVMPILGASSPEA